MQINVTRCDYCDEEKTEATASRWIHIRTSNDFLNNLVITTGSNHVLSSAKSHDWCSSLCMRDWMDKKRLEAETIAKARCNG